MIPSGTYMWLLVSHSKVHTRINNCNKTLQVRERETERQRQRQRGREQNQQEWEECDEEGDKYNKILCKCMKMS